MLIARLRPVRVLSPGEGVTATLTLRNLIAVTRQAAAGQATAGQTFSPSQTLRWRLLLVSVRSKK